MEPRHRHLLARALDGELTPVERQELERRRRASRALDREARAWDRVESALRASLDEAPPLAVDRIGARVAARAAGQRRVRPWMAAASIAALLVLALAPELDRPEPPIAQRAPSTAPVEIHLEPTGDATALVRIDF